MPLIMDSMQGAVLAQALVPRGPSTPAQHKVGHLHCRVSGLGPRTCNGRSVEIGLVHI